MATLYWYGWSGSMSDYTNHLSYNSGNIPSSPASAPPTSSDDIVFDNLSSATDYTATIDTSTSCRDFTMGAPASWKVTWAGSGALSIYWSVNLSWWSAWITRTYTWSITFASIATWKTILFWGVSFATAMAFSWVGGWWTFQDNFSISSGGITHTAWSIDFWSVTIWMWSFASTWSTTRSVNMWSSTLNLSATAWWTLSWSNLSFTKWTSTILVSSFNSNFQWWGYSYNTVNLIWATGSSQTLSWNNTFVNLTWTWYSNKTSAGSLNGNQVVTWTLNFSWNSVLNRLLLSSSTKWTVRTITCTWATLNYSNVDFQDVSIIDWSAWTISSVWDCWNNTGITFDSPVTTDCSAWTTWSTATWSLRVPLPQDLATFSGSLRTITQDMPRIWWVNFSGSSWITWTTSTVCSYFWSINLTDLSGFTAASTQVYTFEWRGNYTLNTWGKTWPKNFVANAPGWKLTLLSNLTVTPGWSPWFQLLNWEFDANDFNVTLTASSFNSQTWTRILRMGNWIWEFQWTWSIWNMFQTTGMTVYSEGSTIKITNTSNSTTTFEWNNFAYNNIYYSRGASTASNTITWSNSYNDIKDDGTVAHSLLFTAATTTNIKTFSVNWTAWNLISINSTTTGTFNLVNSNGYRISCDYLNIQHCIATPLNSWFAWKNSVNNQWASSAWSGWYFIKPPTSNSLLLFS